MEYNKFDNEYYVMNVDGANNHPMITWGSTDFTAFLKAKPIDEKKVELPLKLMFAQPYPKEYEMADLLMLDSLFSVSEKFKNLFEQMGIFGVQFVPAEIKSNKCNIIQGHYAAHIWNKLEAIDNDNYEGDEPDEEMGGKIFSLQRFSLNANLLNDIPLEKRLLFGLMENDTIVVVHQSIYDAIQSKNLTGMKFFKVSDWDEDAMFR